ncbi:Fpg/Nei family DNA glycosylase [Methanobacterium petrolearium]|uniref:Fpg/Nei family DNA glycosylase n=1 Tax=Methanobacterium petrolearium TaxID=710190 RepID=UPI001AEA51F3|nr:Fpg/Nei family DNA glycosylase [Methanobacterium petrolearium]MBP1946925.1 formamidopyrimidine-DNA glycosylase [Methanobacterium petrolearium]BDZ72058.1 formamidopyrimidine-DNA glycosylase [Methanobacterium petrolearium]
MPELPSVAIFKNYFDETSLNQSIKDVKVLSPEILIDTSTEKMKTTLKGHRFIDSQRYGKYLFGKLDNNLFLIMHFGMTGYLDYVSENNHKHHQLLYSTKSSKYPRLIIQFSGGDVLAFDDARKLGKLGITRAPDKFIELKKLGPDALEVNFEDFQEMVKGRKGMIKPLLMNQNVIAGIGNLYADEILYQSHVHPMTHADKLNVSDWEDLFKNMRKVLDTAIEYHDEPGSLPKSYLLPHRCPGGECPEGGSLEVIKVAGRTTFLCPHRQKIR